MNRLNPVLLCLSPMLVLLGCSERPASYRADIKPFTEKYCIRCHGEGGQGSEVSGLRLDDYESLMKGTQYGPIVKPGDSFSSVLVMLVEGRADPSLRMPHDDGPKPSQTEIELVKTWIDQGAKKN